MSQVILDDVDDVLGFLFPKLILEFDSSPEVKECCELIRLNVVLCGDG